MARKRRQGTTRRERSAAARSDKTRVDRSTGDRAIPDRPVPHIATHAAWRVAAVCLVLVLVTAFCYRDARNGEFLTYDDLGYVLENQRVQQGVTLRSLAWAFTSFDAANWHPLTWISHMIDWQLYGKNPRGHHLTSVAWHAANAVLLFLLLLYMTGFLWRSAVVAFLFALHPAHVESVAWISERKDVLCAFFWFLTLLAYAWYARRPSWKRYVAVVCGFACALLSKPMAVTLPFTLLLLDYWPLRRMTSGGRAAGGRGVSSTFSSLWKLCVEKLPLFVMAAASSVVTFSAQRAGGAVAALEALPLWERLCNAAIGYWRYVRLMFWPDPLTAYYCHEKNNIAVSAAVAAAIGLCLVTAACWRFRKEEPYCLMGWLWFLGTLAPVIGIVQVGDQAIAERYTYVPYIGLFIAVVWLGGAAVTRFPKIRIAVAALAVAMIAACGVKTDAQVKVWKDTVTLFDHAIAIDPCGGVPYLSLGMAYGRQGNTAAAEENFKRALDYNPSGPLALAYSAYYLMQTREQKSLPLAGQRLELALRVAPEYPAALTYMAQWSSLMGRPKDEETYARRALAAHPDSIEARLYLADALQAQGNFAEGELENRHVLAAEPNNWEAHNNLGTIFARQGLKEEALKELRLSLAIKPDQAVAHSQMGRIFAEERRFPEAVEEFTQALRFDLGKASAHNDLGVALFFAGEYQKAAEEFGEAVRMDPANADARRNLGLAQARLQTSVKK